MREGMPPGGATAGAEAGVSGNGAHESAAAPAAPPAAPTADQPRESVEPAPPREYHFEPRESTGTHEAAPLAHFEPAPKPEPAGPAKQPYVVWSSAPPKDVGGSRGPEE